MGPSIVIHFQSPNRADQQFPVQERSQLTIGRDPDCNILFDPNQEYVSRRHAAIRIDAGPQFILVDLGSRNGTRLNGTPITEETELAPGDVVELGDGGPKFTFDLQPRPANYLARTRLVPKGMPATRVARPEAPKPEVPAPKPEAPAPRPEAPAPKPEAARSVPAEIEPTKPPMKTAVGPQTVIGLIAKQQSLTNRHWAYIGAAALAVVLLGGGALYWHSKSRGDEATAALAEQAEELHRQKEAAAAQAAKQAAELRAQREASARAVEEARNQGAAAVRSALGMTSREIVQKFGNAVVLIEVQWRLFDKQSDKPLFHKAITVKGKRYPAYVLLPNRKFVRWLTTEDENQSNFPVGIAALGSGFVVASQGTLLTNKHVAAGWTVPYEDDEYKVGIAFDLEQKERPFVIDPSSKDELNTWLPERGVLFRGDLPLPIGDRLREFDGHNEKLEVRFPGSPNAVRATLLRVSMESDVAVIKVETDRPLTVVELSDGKPAEVGETVTVLGYPSFSLGVMSRVVVNSTELGNRSRHLEVIPEPTVTTGNISLVATGLRQTGGVTTQGVGEAYQLTVPSTHGNSGGPVFDHNGKVIGIFTYGTDRETTTYAVPIKFGLNLLQAQRPNQR